MRHKALFLRWALITWMMAFAFVVVIAPHAAAQSRARGWLGIIMESPKPQASQGKPAQGQPIPPALPGVVIKEVLRSSPASKAGLKKGDRITWVDGVAVTKPSDVSSLVGARSMGETLRIKVARASATVDIAAVLGAMPNREQLFRLQWAGKPAPEWTGARPVANGPPMTLASQKGKVVLAHFWASWCTACRASIPGINSLHAQYAPRGLSVVGMASQTVADVTSGAQQFGLQYPTLADPDNSVSETWAVMELPTLVFIDRKGIIRDVMTGYDGTRSREMTALIDKLIAEAP